MKPEIASAWARLRGALYGASPKHRPGKCLVNQADLELLLAEIEQLSNMQMARYLIRIVLEELRNGDKETARNPAGTAKGRTRRHPVFRGFDRPAADRGVAEIAGPFVFGDDAPCGVADTQL